MTYLRFVRENALFLSAGYLLTLTATFGQTHFIAIFAGEVRETFGLSHGAWGGIYTLGTTASAVAMIWVGGLADRMRVRRLGVIVMLVMACACLAMATVGNAVLLVGVIFALRLTGQGMLGQLAGVAMSRWFKATRGRALAIASMGGATGLAFMPFIFVNLMSVFDWRTLWIIAAGIVLLMIPVISRTLRRERTPQSLSETSETTGMAGRHWTRTEVIFHPVFWLVVPAMFGNAAWGTSLYFHQVHLTEVKGWPLAQFTAIFPLLTASFIAAIFATGWAIDRWGAIRILPLSMIPYTLSFVVLAMAQSIPTAAVGLVLFGLSTGIKANLINALLAELYGTRNMGSIKAAAAAIMVFGSAVGPGITGYVIDAGINLADQLYAFSAYFALAGGTSLLAVRHARREVAK